MDWLQLVIDVVGGAVFTFLLTLASMLGVYAVRGIWRQLIRPRGEGDAWGFDADA